MGEARTHAMSGGTGGYLLPTNRPQTHLQPHRHQDASAFPDALSPSKRPCQPRILAAWTCARLHFPSNNCLGPTPWAWWVSWDLAPSPPSAAGDGGRQLPALAPCASRPRGSEWSSLTFSGGGGLRSLLLTARALVLPWTSAVNCAAPLMGRSCGLLLASSTETEGLRGSDFRPRAVGRYTCGTLKRHKMRGKRRLWVVSRQNQTLPATLDLWTIWSTGLEHKPLSGRRTPPQYKLQDWGGGGSSLLEVGRLEGPETLPPSSAMCQVAGFLTTRRIVSDRVGRVGLEALHQLACWGEIALRLTTMARVFVGNSQRMPAARFRHEIANNVPFWL